MKRLAQDEYDRLTEAFISKHTTYHPFPTTKDELYSIIACCIVDTELVLSGVLCIEDFEE